MTKRHKYKVHVRHFLGFYIFPILQHNTNKHIISRQPSTLSPLRLPLLFGTSLVFFVCLSGQITATQLPLCVCLEGPLITVSCSASTTTTTFTYWTYSQSLAPRYLSCHSQNQGLFTHQTHRHLPLPPLPPPLPTTTNNSTSVT